MPRKLVSLSSTRKPASADICSHDNEVISVPYLRSVDSVPLAIDRLRDVVATSGSSAATVPRGRQSRVLFPSEDGRSRRNDSAAAHRSTDSALAIVKTNRGRDDMHDARRIAGSIREQEAVRLAARSADLTHYMDEVTWVVIIGTGCRFLIALLVNVLLAREAAVQIAARGRARRSAGLHRAADRAHGRSAARGHRDSRRASVTLFLLSITTGSSSTSTKTPNRCSLARAPSSSARTFGKRSLRPPDPPSSSSTGAPYAIRWSPASRNTSARSTSGFRCAHIRGAAASPSISPTSAHACARSAPSARSPRQCRSSSGQRMRPATASTSMVAGSPIPALRNPHRRALTGAMRSIRQTRTMSKRNGIDRSRRRALRSRVQAAPR